MNPREQILASIRNAIGGNGSDRQREYAAIPRLYRTSGTLDPAGRVALFMDRLRDYDATVRQCTTSQISNAVAVALSARAKRTMLIPDAVPPDWLPSGFRFIRGAYLSYGELDRSEGVLTGCAVAIAETGTIVLQHSQEYGSRALTLIPDYHLCIVFEKQIVESVPEGIRALSALQSFPLTTISGPSATADIEMTRVKGVHGPRTLDVILISETAPRDLL